MNEKLSYCKHCKLPKHQCQCTKGEWSGDYKQIKTLPEDTGYCPRCNNCWNIHDCPEIGEHQHKWEIDKLAGFIKKAIEGVYIICRNCGEVRLVEVKFVK